MLSLEKINEYVSLVCSQVRWKKAHNRIKEEMKNHIIDQRDAYAAQGLDEDTATERAITETGDAALLGSQLDRTHRPKPQWGLLAATGALLLLGILIRVFIFREEDYYGYLYIRLAASAVGIAVMLAAYFSDFSILGKYPKAAFGIVVALSGAGLFLSSTVNGSRYFMQFAVQYAILLFPLAFSAMIFAMRNKGYRGLILCELAFALPALIAVFVPSITGFLLFTASGIALLCIAACKQWFGVKKTHGFLTMLVPAAFLAALFFMNMNSFGWERAAVAANPSLDPTGAGYIGVMTRELLSGAKLIGRGIIPEEYNVLFTESAIFQTDLLLTRLIAGLGWISFIIIMGILLFVIIKGFILCLKQKSTLGLFISLAVMMTFTFQVVSYVIFNLGFQFLAPMSLPLLSHGGTATIINMGLIGFMLSVFRTGNIAQDNQMIPKKEGEAYVADN